MQRDGAAAEAADAPAHPVRDGRPADAASPRCQARVSTAARWQRKGGPTMTTRTDTLVIGAGSAGLFCALRWAEHGSVTVVEAGPDAGDPPPHWALYDYALPEEYYYRYTDAGHRPGRSRRAAAWAAARRSTPRRRCAASPGATTAGRSPAGAGPTAWKRSGAIESDQQYPDAAYHGADGLIPITRLDAGAAGRGGVRLVPRRRAPARPTTTTPRARSATASGPPTGATAAGGAPGPAWSRPPGEAGRADPPGHGGRAPGLRRHPLHRRRRRRAGRPRADHGRAGSSSARAPTAPRRC